MKAKQIFEELKNCEQLPIGCEASLKGYPIPQISISIEDVEQAIKENPDFDKENPLSDYGFLTSIYMSALDYDNIDYDKYPEWIFDDLFVEFA